MDKFKDMAKMMQMKKALEDAMSKVEVIGLGKKGKYTVQVKGNAQIATSVEINDEAKNDASKAELESLVLEAIKSYINNSEDAKKKITMANMKDIMGSIKG